MKQWLCVWACWLCSVACSASAETLHTEKAYFLDSSARLSPEQIPPNAYRPFTGVLTLGYQEGVVWVRLRAVAEVSAPDNPSAPAQAPQWVSAGPFFMEHIDLYQKDDEGRWLVQGQGMSQPNLHDLCPIDLHCFALHHPWRPGDEVYLRVDNPGAKILQSQLQTEQELARMAALHAARTSASLAVAVVLLLIGLALLWLDKSVLFLAFCGFQWVIVLHQISSTSMLAGMDGYRPDLFRLFFVLRMGLGVALGWALLYRHTPPRWYTRSVQVLVLVCVLNVLGLGVGWHREALFLSYVVFFVSLLVQFLGVRKAQNMEPSQRLFLLGVLLLGMVLVVLGSVVFFANVALPSSIETAKFLSDWRWNGTPMGVGFFVVVLMERTSRQKANAEQIDRLRGEAEQARLHEERWHERSALLEVLAHELKNPLGTVRFALVSLRRQQGLTDEVQQRLQRISSATLRMDDLIEKVSRFHRIDSMLTPSALEPLAVAEWIDEAIEEHATHARFSQTVIPGLRVMADRHLLALLLENLISNASKYALPGSTVEVNAWQSDGRVSLDIRNEVASDCLPDASQLFQRYYRHPGFPDKPGMGLGLNLVQTAAVQMGGQVHYRQQNQQVVFSVTLPAA